MIGLSKSAKANMWLRAVLNGLANNIRPHTLDWSEFLRRWVSIGVQVLLGLDATRWKGLR